MLCFAYFVVVVVVDAFVNGQIDFLRFFCLLFVDVAFAKIPTNFH